MFSPGASPLLTPTGSMPSHVGRARAGVAGALASAQAGPSFCHHRSGRQVTGGAAASPLKGWRSRPLAARGVTEACRVEAMQPRRAWPQTQGRCAPLSRNDQLLSGPRIGACEPLPVSCERSLPAERDQLLRTGATDSHVPAVNCERCIHALPTTGGHLAIAGTDPRPTKHPTRKSAAGHLRQTSTAIDKASQEATTTGCVKCGSQPRGGRAGRRVAGRRATGRSRESSSAARDALVVDSWTRL